MLGFVTHFSYDSSCWPTKRHCESAEYPHENPRDISPWHPRCGPHLLHGLLHSRDICQHCQDFTLPGDVVRSQETCCDKSRTTMILILQSPQGQYHKKEQPSTFGMAKQNQWKEAPTFFGCYINITRVYILHLCVCILHYQQTVCILGLRPSVVNVLDSR